MGMISPSRYETLKLVAQGLTNREIARRRNLAVDTVRKDVIVLLRLFGARNRTHLAAILYRERVV